jgi:hypothetical protein
MEWHFEGLTGGTGERRKLNAKHEQSSVSSSTATEGSSKWVAWQGINFKGPMTSEILIGQPLMSICRAAWADV